MEKQIKEIDEALMQLRIKAENRLAVTEKDLYDVQMLLHKLASDPTTPKQEAPVPSQPTSRQPDDLDDMPYTKQEGGEATNCAKCGKPHHLQDSDAGSERELARLCESCYTSAGLVDALEKIVEDLMQLRIKAENRLAVTEKDLYDVQMSLYAILDKYTMDTIARTALDSVPGEGGDGAHLEIDLMNEIADAVTVIDVSGKIKLNYQKVISAVNYYTFNRK